jgi:hypothetical protein
VLYRWFNRIETCDLLFNQPDFDNKSIFESYILDPYFRIESVLEYLHKWPPPYITGAFIIVGHPGFSKEEGILRYFHKWCQKPWKEQWVVWQDRPPFLVEMYEWLKADCQGLGTFMAAQLVADLKYLPFMKDVPDWSTWAAPGPGSMRGLNVVLGYPMNDPWNIKDWQEKIQELNAAENEQLIPLGLGPFHAQDTQYTKVMTGAGRPRQIYRRVAC